MKIRSCLAGIALALHLGGASALAQNAYITNFGSDTVSVVNTATDSVTATINIPHPPSGRAAPFGVAVSPDGSKTYVTNQFANTVSAINNATGTVATIAVGNGPSGVAITPDGSEVYVTNQTGNTVGDQQRHECGDRHNPYCQ